MACVRPCVRKQSRTVAELLLVRTAVRYSQTVPGWCVQYEYTTRRVRRYEYSRTSTVDPSPPPAYSTSTVLAPSARDRLPDVRDSFEIRSGCLPSCLPPCRSYGTVLHYM